MNEDLPYLLIVVLIQISTMGMVAYRSQHKWRTFLIHLSIFLFYSTYFIYNLIYNSAGGVALVWFFYLIVFLFLHWLVCIVQIIFRKTKPD